MLPRRFVAARFVVARADGAQALRSSGQARVPELLSLIIGCGTFWFVKLMVTAGALLLWVAALFQAGNVTPVQAPNPKSGASQQQAKSEARGARIAQKRTIPCKTPENAALCYWTRGRLSFYAHRPPLRLWKIGTDRLLSVYSGPSGFPPRNKDQLELPELPTTLSRVYDDLRNWNTPDELFDPFVYWSRDIFADFEVCPLRAEERGRMPPVCIESAKNVFVEKD